MMLLWIAITERSTVQSAATRHDIKSERFLKSICTAALAIPRGHTRPYTAQFALEMGWADLNLQRTAHIHRAPTMASYVSHITREPL